MAPVSLEAMVKQALSRVDDVTDTYPSTRAPMYKRLGVTQLKLFVRAAQINPEYYGTNVSVTLVSGSGSLAAAAVSELIQRVEILNPGTSGYAAGREVSIVSLTDPDGELAPRATLRQKVLAQVGTDLANVTSLRVFGPLLPAAIANAETGTTLLSLDQPWDQILEVDLAMWIVGKATALAADVRAAAVAQFAGEKKDLMAEFEAHITAVTPTVARFMPPLQRPGGVS